MGGLVQLALAVAIGLATGWFGGTLVNRPAEAPGLATEAPMVSLKALPGAEALVELPPITTNLMDPDGAWARLELSLVFADRPSAALANRVHADALAYLRTLAVHQIASPSGFLFLRSDLAARAADLTDGAVTNVLVRTFLIE